MRSLVLLASLVLPACSAHVGASLLDKQALLAAPAADAERYDRQVLLRGNHLRFRVESRAVFTDYEIHEAVRVLGDSGREAGKHVSYWAPGAELAGIEGRVISPSGAETKLERSQVFFVNDSEGVGRSRLSFQLPNVTVGSVVEYDFVITVPGLVLETHDDLTTNVPIERYELQLDASTGLQHAFRLFGVEGQAPPQEDEDIGYRTIRWHADHLLPRSGEQLDDTTAPRWVYRNTAFNLGNAYRLLAHGWEDVFHDSLQRTALQRFSQGVPAHDFSRCGESVSCRVREAWATVHQLTDTTRVGDLKSARPLAAVVASRRATRHEQVLLFQKLAADAGLTVDLVFITDRFLHQLDHDFPSTLHDDVVTYVRPQGDLPGGMFVDASCESCEPGVLRDVVDRCDGVRAYVKATNGERIESWGGLATLYAKHVVTSEQVGEIEVTVDESGDLEVEERFRSAGPVVTGLRELALRPSGGSAQAAAELGVKKNYAHAQLIRFEPLVCDKKTGLCTQTNRYKVSQGAAAVDGRLMMPLAALSGYATTLFTATERKDPITVRAGHRMTETLTVKLPKGWKVAEAPSGWQGAAAAFNARVEVKQDADEWVLTREFVLSQGRWPATDYAKAREVVRRFADLRDEAIVLVRQ